MTPEQHANQNADTEHAQSPAASASDEGEKIKRSSPPEATAGPGSSAGGSDSSSATERDNSKDLSTDTADYADQTDGDQTDGDKDKPAKRSHQTLPFQDFGDIADACNMSLADLAEQIGYSRSAPSKWAEKGEIPLYVGLACETIQRRRKGPAKAIVEIRQNGFERRDGNAEVRVLHQDRSGVIMEVSL